MALFQKSVLNKYLAAQNQQQILQQFQLYKSYFLNPAIQKNIIASKEEEFQEGFLRELFVKIFGYTINPEPEFNLRTELKNQKDSKKADGAIIDGENVLAVIELKSTTTTDLNKIEIQAFNYKNNQKDCRYIITSNFQKVRFYIDNAIEYLEWDLFKLDAEQFNLLFLCLSKENIFANLPATIKAESITEEENVTKKLYKEYSSFRKELFNNIAEKNPQLDKLLLFKKTQKLLDRFLFLFFAEDRNLVPPNSVRLILEQWIELKEKFDEYQPLYERFKKYFGYLNNGYIGKQHEIFAYNGGLFATDEILDAISIDDTILYNATLSLSRYDYNSDVDVNILGHIFEHSLTEIEELESAIIAGEETIAKTSKRKKDGVFYTPKYITKYIVENTVGSLCRQKKEELHLQEEDYHTLTKKERKKLNETLQQYKNWLLTITIVDPACGSGAFLNQTLEYLIAEHNWIAELEAKIFNTPMVLTDVETSILENNLFGVDINEESVEIAKLSLWLRTARKGRKLNSLNNNIKCGNSLIDDPAIAGDKAFNWQQQFPHIFEKGGFDVVIGNPPYVKLEMIKSISEALENLGYKTYEKRGDLYVLFVEKGFNLLKEKGVISFIMPNKWLQAGYGKPLREYLLQQKLNTLIDFGDLQIFEGATTYPCIFVAEKSHPNQEINISVLNKSETDFVSNVIKNQQSFQHNSFSSETWVISSNNDKELIDKLQIKFESLEKFVEGEAFYGIKFGLTEAFLIDDIVKEKILKEDESSSDLLGKVLRGRDLTRYGSIIPSDLDNIILAHFGSYKDILDKYPAIHNHLIKYENKLKARGQCNGSKATNDKPFLGQHHWLELDNNPSRTYLEQYKKPKIMYQTFQVKPCFVYDEDGLYCNNSMWIIPTDNKSLLAILNSKMGWWLISKFCTQIQNGYQLIWKYFGLIPIPDVDEKHPLAGLADKMISINKKLSSFSILFQNNIRREFGLEKLSNKLQDWYNLSYNEFLNELKKNKITLSLSQKAEWESYFVSEKEAAINLTSEIDKTDKEIDQMVYQLYGVTDEEIKIVEGN